MVTKQKILIVDDDENIAELISLYLTKECFETKIVYDGESALDALPSFKPNLILLDLMLPGIDGREILSRIRGSATLRELPVIMLTAKGTEFDVISGLDAGADDYLAKPFSMMELISRSNALLRRTHRSHAYTGHSLSLIHI